VDPLVTASTAAERLQLGLDLSYRYLGRRDRTVLEVRRHLEAKRVDPATIDATVAELQDQGYLDDARYAQRFTEDRRTLDAWGADRIERKLRTAGVAPDLIERAIDDSSGGTELDAAIALLERRFGAPPEDDRERARALGLLARKGYELELAYDAVRAFHRG
jgi:regulatory protein